MKRLSLACLLATLLILALAPAQAFTVYDATLHKHKPSSLKDLGFTPLEVLYEDGFFRSKKAAPNEEPDLAITRDIANRVKYKADIVCVDIEVWEVFKAPPQVAQTSIRRLISVLETMRAAAPKLKIGYYGTLPVVDYWAPAGKDQNLLRTWQEANTQLQAVAKHVDIIFPSLYTFYDDPAGWKKYAIATIQEAKRYGKPVYPFLWYQYHDSNKLLGGKPIPAAIWRMQLETCLKYADGVVIWGGYKELWSEEAAWWQETKTFMNALSTGKMQR
ncbi:MAG: hypothetical protein C0405_00030 [Desulfovibrio sp.]|nr:hypothetical protein [Desulfovibrio sp.]